MFEMIVRYKNRWGISVLLAVVVFCGSTSCQRSGKSGKPAEVSSKEGRKSEKDKESVVRTSVDALDALETVISADATENDCNDDPGDDIVACLTSRNLWLMDAANGKDARFATRFCRLMGEYVIDLIERSSSEDAVVSLESFCQFLVKQDVRLIMRRVEGLGLGCNKIPRFDLAGTWTYVVDDIVGGPFGLPDTNMDGDVLLVGFGIPVNGEKLWALCQLLRAMDFGYVVSAGDSVSSVCLFARYFLPLLPQVESSPLDCYKLSDRYLQGVCVQSGFFDGSSYSTNRALFEEFVSLLRKYLFQGVVEYVKEYLECKSKSFTISGSMRDSTLTITDSGNRPCRGLLADALVLADGNATDVISVRLPRIIFVMKENIVHVLGIIKTIPSDGRLSLGVRYRGLDLTGRNGIFSWEGTFSHDLVEPFGNGPFGDGAIDFSCLEDSKDTFGKERHFSQALMSALYGNTWKDGSAKYRFVLVPYDDCVRLFYKNVFSAFLKHFEELTSKE